MTSMINEILGTSEADRIDGTDGADMINGLDGADTIDGGAGNDFLTGGAGVDRILGGDGNDFIYDLTGEDTMTGGNGRDFLFGGRVMNGDDGDDILVSSGAAENVIMIGSAGADIYVGSDDSAESYSYLLFADFSDPTAPDTIYNFDGGQDTLDFSGEQPAITFVGDAAFAGTADGSAEARFADGLFEMDLDGDQVADFAVELVGVESLTADDLDGFITDATGDGGPDTPLPVEQIFGTEGQDTFTGSDDIREVYRYNLFFDESPADNPDVIQNFQPGQDSIFYGELGTRIDFLGEAAFSGDPDPLLGIEARFADERLEVDWDGDAVADQVIVLEGVETLTADEFFL